MIGLARLAMLKGYIDVSRGNGNCLSEVNMRVFTPFEIMCILIVGFILLCLFITMCIWWDKLEREAK